MQLLFPRPLMILAIISIAVIAALLLLRRKTAAAASAPSSHPRLDTVGLITNWILGVLYLPLSLFFFLMGGMASEICMDSMTPAKEVLCGVLTILALFTFPVSEGGILASVLLRRKGSSIQSFVIQFAGFAYGCIMLLLISFL